jgi:hypothetical protein
MNSSARQSRPPSQRLRLTRETLRELQGPALGLVAGGATNGCTGNETNTCTNISATCLTTECSVFVTSLPEACNTTGLLPTSVCTISTNRIVGGTGPILTPAN